MNLLQNPNKRRWYIVATIFVAIICNYLDRQLLSILKPEILTHFGIEDLQYAWIVNVFLICYAIMYPISGILVDRFGSKKVMLGGIVAWSLACIGGGLSTNVVEFTICRGILGLAEPTIFAGQIVAVTLWFEKRHRATAKVSVRRAVRWERSSRRWSSRGWPGSCRGTTSSSWPVW